MHSRQELTVITAITEAVNAVFNAFETAYYRLTIGAIKFTFWVCIVGFALVFISNNIEFEMNIHGANLDLSMESFMFSLVCYAFLTFIRSFDKSFQRKRNRS